MAAPTKSNTETKVRPDDDAKAVAKGITGERREGQAEGQDIDSLIEAQDEATDAILEAAMELHDIRDSLIEKVKATSDDSPAKQGIQGAVFGIEDSIRSLDAALQKSAARGNELKEIEAAGLESGTEIPEVSSRGRQVSRQITQSMAETKGYTHIPGSQGGLTYPEAKTPEEIEELGIAADRKDDSNKR
jgi:hypothetical protein